MSELDRDNPKLIQAQKDGKLPLEYLVTTLWEGDAAVHKHGADKYGICNWRKDPIKASTYKAAMLRHLKAWLEGEDIDPDSGYHHLYHLRAGAGIVLDAEMHDTLIDDRALVQSFSQDVDVVLVDEPCDEATPYTLEMVDSWFRRPIEVPDPISTFTAYDTTESENGVYTKMTGFIDPETGFMYITEYDGYVTAEDLDKAASCNAPASG